MLLGTNFDMAEHILLCFLIIAFVEMNIAEYI